MNQPKRGIFAPVVFNLALVWGAAGLVGGMVAWFHVRMAAVSLTENRFITMEWSLLQQLKLQTDTQLLQKDQEIADLRRQYLRLAEANSSPSELKELETRLQEVDDAREKIASQGASSAGGSAATPQIVLPEVSPLVDPAKLPELLMAHINTLQAQLDERRLYAQMLEQQLATSNNVQTPQPAAADAAAEIKRAEELQRKLAEAKTAVAAARSQVEKAKQEINVAGTLSIENLNTWTLLRALVSSPEIRVKYPDLLKSMDQYFQAYGNQQRQKGNLEAYSAALQTLDALTRQIEGP
jgi:DNA repair exonuclease SbcCD ATPase subunit